VAEASPEAAAAKPSPAVGEPKDREAILQSISGEIAAILAKCKDAIVRIKGVDRYGAHAGTGFFIDTNGTIYTHYSVGGASRNLVVEFADKRYPATCVLADPRSGVTLLKIQAAPTPFLPIGRSEDLKVASPLVAVGYPLDLPVSPSFGLVAGFDQKILDHYLTTTHIRANVPVQAGEQGAPLLNAKGEVVGILVCRIDYGAACLALPIQAAEKVRGDYLRFGEPRPGWVGVTIAPLGEEDSAELKVVELAADAPVASSGIKDGDLLLQVGRTPIRKIGDLRDASFFLTADEMVPITVRRDNETLTFNVRAIRPPGSPPLISSQPKPSEGMRLSLP
jgi:serine protease Do